ncbi:hypothetical protein L1987_20441 [Smallanthus sonchifolius]|uniref:Uncharacterized protein n=1 Tax=Smallanthus sonchifolius TaxID=185202 RepID=A0ACB9IRC5_9ASTR|nr:hypothetical protein L1987_20441 [Smallanthus sonchifolius]
MMLVMVAMVSEMVALVLERSYLILPATYVLTCASVNLRPLRSISNHRGSFGTRNVCDDCIKENASGERREGYRFKFYSLKSFSGDPAVKYFGRSHLVFVAARRDPFDAITNAVESVERHYRHSLIAKGRRCQTRP